MGMDYPLPGTDIFTHVSADCTILISQTRFLEPLFSDFGEDQSRKLTVWSQEGDMLAMSLNGCSNHAE
jgi:hypothetical protein